MKRLTSMDFLRGIAIFFMVIFHILFTSWNRFATVDINTMSIGLLIVAILIGILIHWRGFFLMISAIVNVFQMMMSFKKGEKRSTIFGKQILAGFVMVILGKIWGTFFPYWGFIESWTRGVPTLAESWEANWDLFFMIEAIESIGYMMIVIAFFFLLFTSKLLQNRWQINVIICYTVGVIIIAVSPVVIKEITVIAGIDLAASTLDNFRRFGYILQEYPPIVEMLVRIPLVAIGGREAPLFPMMSYYFFGAGISLVLTNGAPTKAQLRIFYIASVLALAVGAYEFIVIEHMPLDLFFHVHPRWFAFMSMGLQIPIVVAFLIWIEFNPRLHQDLWLKSTRFIRRFGFFALTVYFFGIFDAITRYIFGLIFTDVDFILRYRLNDMWTFILTGTVLILWCITLFIWDKVFKGYGSVEFLVSLIRRPKSGQKRDWHDPLNLKGALWDVEMITYWK